MPQPDEAMRVLEAKASQLNVITFFHAPVLLRLEGTSWCMFVLEYHFKFIMFIGLDVLF